MSLRRELYRGRQGTPIGQTKTSSDENNHWERDWYDPPIVNKEDTIAALMSGNNGSTLSVINSSTPDITMRDANGNTPINEKSTTPSYNSNETGQQQLHGYEVKTWIIKGNETSTDEIYKDFDTETNPKATYINLNQYKYVSVIRKGVNLGPKKVVESVSGSLENGESGEGDKNNNEDINMIDNDDEQDGDMDATDIKAAVGGVGGDKLFSSSASIDHT